MIVDHSADTDHATYYFYEDGSVQIYRKGGTTTFLSAEEKETIVEES